MVFLCKPDLPKSVQLSPEVTLKRDILCFSFRNDWGSYDLLWDLYRHQPFGNQTFTMSGIPKPSICKFSPLGAWSGEEAWRSVHSYISSNRIHKHLYVFYIYSITYVIIWLNRQITLLFTLKYMYAITSVAADRHNTMYSRQVTNQPKWQIQQQEIISLGYEFM